MSESDAHGPSPTRHSPTRCDAIGCFEPLDVPTHQRGTVAPDSVRACESWGRCTFVWGTRSRAVSLTLSFSPLSSSPFKRRLPSTHHHRPQPKARRKMSSLAPRSLRTFAPLAGPSYTTGIYRAFSLSAGQRQAVAVEDKKGERIWVPLQSKSADSTESEVGGFLRCACFPLVVTLEPTSDPFVTSNSRHFAPRTSIPPSLPSRLLVKITTPLQTTNPQPSTPQALVHDSTRDLYFHFSPPASAPRASPVASTDAAYATATVTVSDEKKQFDKLMKTIRAAGEYSKVFWAEPKTSSDGAGVVGLEVLVDEAVKPEELREAEF